MILYRVFFILSFCSLSYDRSVASSKASSPQSAIQCFLFQFTVSSLFLKVIQQLLTSSSSSFRHFYPSFVGHSNRISCNSFPSPYSRFAVCPRNGRPRSCTTAGGAINYKFLKIVLMKSFYRRRVQAAEGRWQRRGNGSTGGSHATTDTRAGCVRGGSGVAVRRC